MIASLQFKNLWYHMNIAYPELLGLDDQQAPFAPEALNQEECEFRGAIRDFALQELAPLRAEIDKQPLGLMRQLLQKSADMGIMGVDISEEYGGLGMSWKLSSIVPEDLSECQNASYLVSIGAATGIALLPIKLYGTAKQKSQYLPAIAEGKLIGAYCLTEPGSGSDALSARALAIKRKDGSFILSGQKQFITNAAFADYYVVFARVSESTIADKRSLSAFLVLRDTNGVEVASEENKMGLKGSSTASVIFTDTKIPAEALLGNVGEGADIALVTLDMGRLKLGMMDLGLCRKSLDETIKYVNDRKQFGATIGSFGAIRAKLAWMGQRLFALESTAYSVSGSLDKSLDGKSGRAAAAAISEYALESSIVKVFGSESLGLVADHALQCFGGYGFCEDYPLASIVRDTRVDRIFEGSNEINRQVICGNILRALLQGRMPLRETLQSSNDTNSRFDKLRQVFLRLLDAAVYRWGQDLILKQQAAEDFADMAIAIYTMECSTRRMKHFHDKMQDPLLAENLFALQFWNTWQDISSLSQRLMPGLNLADLESGQISSLLAESIPQDDPYKLADRSAVLLTSSGKWAV
jgi:alkylation response protein AidB-like acyl-CoA dehydrogenase